MDFRPSHDQRALVAGMRTLLAARFPREKLRESVDAEVPGDALDRSLWRELGECGFFSLRLSEKDGGAGLGLPEAVFLFEEAGRHLLPGPLIATHLAAGLIPGAAEGETVVTALEGPGMVEHLSVADAVLVMDLVMGGDRPRVLEVTGARGPQALQGRPLWSVDPTTPLHHVERLPKDVRELPLVGADGDTVRLCQEAALLTAAQQLGSAGRTLDMAVSHAKSRRQFGRPIGAFQAVQHLCAQMLARTELARVSVYAASLLATESDIAGAKLLADEAAIRNARDCLQVHGGMGFTWEADVHPHLKRAWLRRTQWQSADEAEEALTRALLDPPGELPDGNREPFE
ncbi:acyl-CoA dehydrogenase family protein [Streptomyces hesseae]|uniref:Acyl-CoA dehydrogenase family protein n=1 Tax=Streptomyces hesseae TaxID=3075519 RepID=A0ABU2SIP3_9ACTN|nr:acyl-CoA dehydrogenase family protein [Streptomyces sp. DSM 40473]MDT0448842.1 acyl-CoA dehydrogenase family protein [Streptomyces sp. DSM 40473]